MNRVYLCYGKTGQDQSTREDIEETKEATRSDLKTSYFLQENLILKKYFEKSQFFFWRS